MGPAANLTEMSSYPLILTEGGDDRLVLDPVSGTNKYHQKPFVASEALFRGSCTCNSPTQVSYDAAEQYYQKFKSGDLSVEVVMQEIRERLAKLYKLDKDIGIFLTPSGSDAEYIPVLLAQSMNPNKKITNIVTCNEEVGSGTLDAAGGRFFSTVEPITGYTESYHKNGVKMSDIVEGIGEDTKTIAIDARKVSGEVVDPHGEILEAIDDCKK